MQITLEDLLAKRKTIKAFLFDLDGTLIDSQEGIINTINEYLEKKGYSFGKEEITQLFGTLMEVVFKTLIPSLTDEEIQLYLHEIREQYSKIHTQITSLFPSTKEILQSLKTMGFKLGIASTKFKKFIIEILEYYNLLNFFDVLVSGYEVENHKPAPDILLETAKRLQVDPFECVYVGDSPSDVQAGKKAGMITIAVLTDSLRKKQIARTKPDFIINSLLCLKVTR